ncbi:hypothetical protein IGI04_039706 [Brassica rapa subsp. trilocularis]|uniref:Uncharacterized protein n=1 Tax=Brassica rapa subsp. trilocularis TaxID=1813537 RepID=A0ABQ7KNP6_BRACM|nr:hypothetical protein IGI04_039706 [Brassica rapa subsp. trilocularis]
MAATKMFLIKWYSSSTNLKVFQIWKTSGTTYLFLIRWYSSSTNLKVFQIWKTSGTTYLLVVWKSSGLLGSLLTKSSRLPGSRLDFLKVIWTSCKVSSELPGSRLDFLKSSGLPGSLLTKFSSISSGVQACLCRGMIYNSFVCGLRLIIQSSTRRLKCKSSRIYEFIVFKVNCKNNLYVDQTTSSSLAYIRLLQAHIITNESNPPRIVSFYDSMNHKNFRIRILGFFSSLWRESEIYVVFSSQEWKKKKGKSILGALRASNWLFMVVVVLMTMAIL